MKYIEEFNIEQLNKQEADILNCLYLEPFINQRILAEMSGHSLGVVNRSIKDLIKSGYVDEHAQLTAKAREEFKAKKPKNAIILAAGFGMRMVPINMTTPKALLEVNGEKLIDRIITQLQEVGINDINGMIGISYLTGTEAETIRTKIIEMCNDSAYDDKFWEEALYKGDRMIVQARIVHASDIVEINTYEQLRDLDSDSNQLKSDALKKIAEQDEFRDYVEFIDISAQFDSEYNMPRQSKPVNTRSSTTEQVGTNGVHPSMDGYLQIGDAAYRALVPEMTE